MQIMEMTKIKEMMEITNTEIMEITDREIKGVREEWKFGNYKN